VFSFVLSPFRVCVRAPVCSGVLRSKTRLGHFVRFVCGEGRFCCPDTPPAIFEEEIQADEEDEIVLGYQRMP
jgi:hypothetical protein